MSDQPRLVAVLPCRDLDIAEAWWNRLGFTRPPDQGYPGYRMLARTDGSEVHLTFDESGWVVPGRNPFGAYLYLPDVDAMADILRGAIIEAEGMPTHKPWGMYEFAVNGPDDLLVRIGWPSRLIAAR